MTIEDVTKALNSEDCMLATGMCLMRYKERDCWKCILKEYSKTVYNKAIDDFVKEICKMIVQSENNGNYRFYAVEIKQAIADLAEQLKAGGDNVQKK